MTELFECDAASDETPRDLKRRTLSFRPDKSIDLPCRILGFLKNKEVKIPSDFTVYIESAAFNAALLEAAQPDISAASISASTSFDLSHSLTFSATGDKSKYTGRVHAVRCCAGSYTSVTFRSLKRLQEKSPGFCGVKKSITAPAFPTRSQMKVASTFGAPLWVYKGEVRSKDQVITGKFLSPESHTGEVAMKGIFPGLTRGSQLPQGLVLITGQTGCGKTTFLNELVFRYLTHLMSEGPDRNPHVVVIGDPIETRLYPDREKSSAQVQALNFGCCPIDFTERVLGQDTPTINDSLQDALRETPSLVVVSELRKPEDFRAVLDFAATGHLIFATSHNTSLVDGAARLIRAVGASNNPGDRAALMQRLHALVHLRPLKQQVAVNGADTPRNFEVNAAQVWRCNSKGSRHFVAEGLSSLSPRSTGTGDWDGPGVLGLSWYVTALRKESEKSANPSDPKLNHHLWTGVTAAAADPFQAFLTTTDHLDLHSY